MERRPPITIILHVEGEADNSNKRDSGSANINRRVHLRIQQLKSDLLLLGRYHAIPRWELKSVGTVHRARVVTVGKF